LRPGDVVTVLSRRYLVTRVVDGEPSLMRVEDRSWLVSLARVPS
jgi:hypothetical protein